MKQAFNKVFLLLSSRYNIQQVNIALMLMLTDFVNAKSSSVKYNRTMTQNLASEDIFQLNRNITMMATRYLKVS